MGAESKIPAYIGFSLRSRQIKIGVNSLSCTKGGVKLLIICHTATPNTFKDANKLSNKFRCPLVISNKAKLEDIVGKENCKLIGLTDKNLSAAVLNNLDDNFVIHSGGNNS